MVRDYELMYIVRPDLDDDRLRATMDSVQTLLEGQGGEVRRTTPWGKRRLAYEIQKLRDGHYVLVEFRLDGARLREVERSLRIHDNVIRHMVTILVESHDGAESGPREEREDGAVVAGEEAPPPADELVEDEADESELEAEEP